MVVLPRPFEPTPPPLDECIYVFVVCLAFLEYSCLSSVLVLTKSPFPIFPSPLTPIASFFSPPHNYSRCLSISYTPLPKPRPESTSSSASYRAPIVFLWTSNAPAVFKSPRYLAMHRQSSFVDHATLCCVSLQVDGLDLRKDAVIGRRLINYLLRPCQWGGV